MKKHVLPLSESFTIHATALLNHIHQRGSARSMEGGKTALSLFRNQELPFRLQDESTFETTTARVDIAPK